MQFQRYWEKLFVWYTEGGGGVTHLSEYRNSSNLNFNKHMSVLNDMWKRGWYQNSLSLNIYLVSACHKANKTVCRHACTATRCTYRMSLCKNEWYNTIWCLPFRICLQEFNRCWEINASNSLMNSVLKYIISIKTDEHVVRTKMFPLKCISFWI